MAIEGGQGRGNNGNPVCGRAFVMGADEARQDPNIVTATFSLNNHYAMMLFDSGADYSFVSTTFVLLLDIKPSIPGFSYKIEIASGQLVEINKVICDCKLEIEGHTFDIDLISFGRGSFDVIIGMDWLSRHRTEIVFHKRVVRFPLPHGEMLRVYREWPKEKVKRLMSAKLEEPKLKDIAIVLSFSEVFPDDLSGLPPSREVEFCIDLIPRSIPVVKSPYRLAPTKIEELSNQLKELQDKGFIRPMDFAILQQDGSMEELSSGQGVFKRPLEFSGMCIDHNNGGAGDGYGSEDFFLLPWFLAVTGKNGISYAKRAKFPLIIRLCEFLIILELCAPVIYFVHGSSRHLAVRRVSIASLVMGTMLNEAVPYAQDPVLYLKLAFTTTFLQASFKRL
ncbi:putative reverse transcriptase domain-containing protein [Tanacetum coccineum]